MLLAVSNFKIGHTKIFVNSWTRNLYPYLQQLSFYGGLAQGKSSFTTGLSIRTPHCVCLWRGSNIYVLIPQTFAAGVIETSTTMLVLYKSEGRGGGGLKRELCSSALHPGHPPTQTVEKLRDINQGNIRSWQTLSASYCCGNKRAWLWPGHPTILRRYRTPTDKNYSKESVMKLERLTYNEPAAAISSNHKYGDISQHQYFWTFRAVWRVFSLLAELHTWL
jgi:hypothetical protein